MKALKVTLALSVLMGLVIGVLLILEVIPSEVAQNYLGKGIGVIVLLGVGVGVISVMMTSSKSNPSSDRSEPGPKF